MLAHILAVLVGTGSVGLYVAAFFLPEIHRKHDFIWSGVGFFYALALWIYARQITGGILVGQTASVALLGWFAWQTLQLRRQLVPANQQTPIPTTTQIQQQLGLKPTGGKQSQPKAKVPTNPKSSTTTVSTPAPVKSPTPAPAIEIATPPQRQATPAKTNMPTVTPLAAEPIQAPSGLPVVNQAAKQTHQATVPSQADVPTVRATQTQPNVTPPTTTEPDEAWIELTVKPTSPPAKPLGQAVKPPTIESTPHMPTSPTEPGSNDQT